MTLILLILLYHERLATYRDTGEGGSVMRYENSVLLHGLLKRVRRTDFELLVDKHGADARVHRLMAKCQFIAPLHD